MSFNPKLSILDKKQRDQSQIVCCKIISKHIQQIFFSLLQFWFRLFKAVFIINSQSSISQHYMCETSKGNSQEQKILHKGLHQQVQLRSFGHLLRENQIFPHYTSFFSRQQNNMSQSKLIDSKFRSFKDTILYPNNISKYRIFQNFLFQSVCQQVNDVNFQKSSKFHKQVSFLQSYDGVSLPHSKCYQKISRLQFGPKSQILCQKSVNKSSFIQMESYLNTKFLMPLQVDQYFQLGNSYMQNKKYLFFAPSMVLNSNFPGTISTKKKQNILSNTFYFQTLEQKYFLGQKNYFEETNCQGCFTMFNPLQNQPLLILKKVNHALRKSSIFALKPFWNEQFRQYLLDLIKNSDIYIKDAYQQLLTFLKINQFKIFCLQSYLQENLYEKIFPGSSFILTTLQHNLQVSSLCNQRQKLKELLNNKRKETKVNQTTMNQINQIFQKQIRSFYKLEKQFQPQKSFFQQLKQFLNMTRKNYKKVDNKFIKQMEQQLNKYLSDLHKTFHQKFVDEIAFCIQSLIYQNLELYKFKSKVLQQKQSFQNQFDSIQNHKLTQSKCMGCSRVFIVNRTIYDPSVSNVPIKNFPTIHKLKDYQVEFKDNICAMMNSGGGVILFDCHQTNQKIYARGQYLTEKQKEQIQQRVTSYFRWFYPKPEINTNIKISFIPITRKRIELQQDQVRKQYQDGVYVTRLRIAPSQCSKLYFWFHSKRQNQKQDRQEHSLKFFSLLDNKNNPILVNLSQARRMMKKRFKDNLNQAIMPNQLMISKPVNIFGHECEQPQMGQQVTSRQSKYQIISKPQEMINQKKSYYNTATSLQTKFNYVTLLIAKKQDLPRIKQKLFEANIQCQIQVRFAKYNLKPANNSAILYHDKSFQIVHHLVTNDPCFRFSTGKAFMAINVTKYLRFQTRSQRNKIDNSTMLKLDEWLKKQFDDQRITFYEYNVDHKKKEYYLQSSSKLSLLFMYFMINNYEQKVTFKNPFNLEKYSIQQKAGQFKKLNIFNPIQQQKQANFFKHKQKQQSSKYLEQ